MSPDSEWAHFVEPGRKKNCYNTVDYTKPLVCLQLINFGCRARLVHALYQFNGNPSIISYYGNTGAINNRFCFMSGLSIGEQYT